MNTPSKSWFGRFSWAAGGTIHPDQVSQSILTDLKRKVTSINATRVYTRTQRSMLYCVICQAHEIFGEGFRPLK